MMNKRLIISFLSVFVAVGLVAQVPKTIVVEHFTNTRCSICKSRNPGFYENFNKQVNALHLSVHPSSPYSSCLLNNFNVADNDGRTNHYGIYGGTPRIIIQGDVIANNTNYGDEKIFDAYKDQESNIEIQMDLKLVSEEGSEDQEVLVDVRLVKHGVIEDAGQRIFVVIAEDTVFYEGPNGEKEHYDVMRDALTTVSGTDISGWSENPDLASFQFQMPFSKDIAIEQLSAFAIVQNEDKSVEQAFKQSDVAMIQTSSVNDLRSVEFVIYPNPVQNVLTIATKASSQVTLFSLDGQLMYSKSVTGSVNLNTSEYAKGVYFVEVRGENGSVSTKQFVKQ